MAHTEHAKKTHRQSLKARERNRAARSAIKTALKAARGAAGGDEKAAVAAQQSVVARLDKAAKNRIIHPNKAARLKSRLAKALNKAKKSS
jgi:small subunit ribosomal protein S20